VATAVADAVDGAVGETDRLVVDLAEMGPDLLDWSAAQVSEVSTAVAASPLLIVASPTYKATYTGLLKVFLDRYGNNGLGNTVAVPVMTGAAHLHALAVESHLRPLLVELGASVPTRGVYVTEPEMADIAGAIAPWAAGAGRVLAAAVSVAGTRG
jgi:FMN reductase